MSVGANIRRLRDLSGMTQEDLAEKLDVARSTVTQWENGWSNPRMGMIQKLAGVFGVSTADIVYDGPGAAPATSGAIPVRGSSAMVPVLSAGSVHAGDRSDDAGSDYEVEFPESVVSRHPGCFALKVEGDCMNRRYPEGCHVLVDPHMEPRNGLAVVAGFEDGRSLLRTYMRGSSTLMLTADSFSDYDDIIVTQDDPPVRTVGVVVWYQADCDVER